MYEMINYNAARSALALAATVDEVKDIRDKAEALRLYARQRNDVEMEKHVAEIKLRAVRKIGQLSASLETAQGPNSKLLTAEKNKTDTLSDAGISIATAHRCEKIAAIAEAEFEDYIDKKYKAGVAVTITDVLKSQNVHVSNNSGENEWYTPANFIEAARGAMGSIDLDPASSELANAIVKAGLFYTCHDNGLDKDWHGNVWLNPPYSQPEIQLFTDKLLSEKFTQACVLVNNATETKWGQRLLDRCAAVCFISSRIRFLDQNCNASGLPLQGQMVLYFGERATDFTSAFLKCGVVLRK